MISRQNTVQKKSVGEAAEEEKNLRRDRRTDGPLLTFGPHSARAGLAEWYRGEQRESRGTLSQSGLACRARPTGRPGKAGRHFAAVKSLVRRRKRLPLLMGSYVATWEVSGR